MASKVSEISNLLISRIRKGDYALNDLPSGRQLAQEVGVSYVTAREAIGKVVDEGWLMRNETGRLELSQEIHHEGFFKVAFVCPAFSASSMFACMYELMELVERRGGVLRQISYSHWDDPVIFESLQADFDGIFLLPPIDMPKVMLNQLAKYKNKLVTLFHDLSDLGIPFVDGAPSDSIDMLINHLYELGHTSIDCLNTQPETSIIDDRILQWRKGLSKRNIKGVLHHKPVRPFVKTGPAACELMTRIIEVGGFDSTAIFCTTVSAAKGVIRALADKNIEVGKDVSVCSFGEDDEAKLMIPRLTVIKKPSFETYLLKALRWIETGGDGWEESLAITPDSGELFIGDSTGEPAGGK